MGWRRRDNDQRVIRNLNLESRNLREELTLLKHQLAQSEIRTTWLTKENEQLQAWLEERTARQAATKPH